jgi:solute carrier family 25, member 38
LFNYSSIPQGIRLIYRKEGFKGIFSGWGVTTLRDAPYAGLYVFFYTRMKPLMNDIGLELNFGNFVSGMWAGLVSTTLCHPFDVVKTRVQLDTRPDINMQTVVREMLNNERLTNFFSGYVARGMRKVLSGAITWTVYEYYLKSLVAL